MTDIFRFYCTAQYKLWIVTSQFWVDIHNQYWSLLVNAYFRLSSQLTMKVNFVDTNQTMQRFALSWRANIFMIHRYGEGQNQRVWSWRWNTQLWVACVLVTCGEWEKEGSPVWLRGGLMWIEIREAEEGVGGSWVGDGGVWRAHVPGEQLPHCKNITLQACYASNYWKRA